VSAVSESQCEIHSTAGSLTHMRETKSNNRGSRGILSGLLEEVTVGNRNTICFIAGSKNDDGSLERQAPIYFLAHWMGGEMRAVCRTAINRAAQLGRLNDNGLVARYLFEALLALDPKEELSFRMTADSAWANDLDNDPLVVDMALGQVLVLQSSKNPEDVFEGIVESLGDGLRAFNKTRLKKLFSFDYKGVKPARKAA